MEKNEFKQEIPEQCKINADRPKSSGLCIFITTFIIVNAIIFVAYPSATKELINVLTGKSDTKKPELAGTYVLQPSRSVDLEIDAITKDGSKISVNISVPSELADSREFEHGLNLHVRNLAIRDSVKSIYENTHEFCDAIRRVPNYDGNGIAYTLNLNPITIRFEKYFLDLIANKREVEAQVIIAKNEIEVAKAKKKAMEFELKIEEERRIKETELEIKLWKMKKAAGMPVNTPIEVETRKGDANGK